jgi:hypothetical protein
MDMDRFMEDAREAILDHGFTVHYSEVRSLLMKNLPWAYTVGRTFFNRPELLIVGPFTQEQMTTMLTDAVEIDQASPIFPEAIIMTPSRTFRALPASGNVDLCPS